MDALDAVEEQRAQLEENVAKVRKALQHWRQWDAEYEGLKEELLSGTSDAGEREFVTLSKDFGGQLVDEKEIRDLTGLDKPPVRQPTQIINVIERRQDYVQQNIKTIEKRLEVAETALTAHLDQEQEADELEAGNASELPISEIIEELDEDDNVISSRVSQPEDNAAKIYDTLHKAGINDLDPKRPATTTTDRQGSNIADVNETKLPDSTAKPDNNPTSKSPIGRKKSVSFSEDTKPPSISSALSHSTGIKADLPEPKSVSFAEEVQEYEIPANAPNAAKGQATPASSVSEDLLRGSFGPDQRVLELDENDEIIAIKDPVIPENESLEDAQRRREMLAYSMNEIGPIVAELELEEGNSDDEDYEDADEFDDEALGLDGAMTEDTSDEEEDEFGRTTKKVITADYRQQMLDLERQLQEKIIGNLGPRPMEEDHPDINADELKRLVIRGDDQGQSAEKSKDVSAGKKTVRFAEGLDVQRSQPKPSAAPTAPTQTATPMEDVVLERSSTSAQIAPEPPKSKPSKPSRFKQNLTSSTSTTPAEPPKATRDGILLDEVLERPTLSNVPAAPSEPDEMDPEIQQRQLTNEYYRLRNSMIRQQGGFKPADEVDDGEGPLMEERDGRVKKVSRFRAARMR
ncbi:hypothetical protein MBLNU457_4341t1 [Dothideomycetes sp. NU457]